MQTLEYRTVDKSAWQRGEWDNEPDKMQWQDEATGLPCLIVRNHMGALCGYVGVSESHSAFGAGYSDVMRPGEAGVDYIDVHGGLTFADRYQPVADESHGICHTPGDGEPDHVWWFGFDCAHSGDVSPVHIWPSDAQFATYKNIAYVKREVAALARQLAGEVIVRAQEQQA